MRPVSDLNKLNAAINCRLTEIRRMFSRAVVGAANESDPYLATAVIELDNLILGSMRVFLISSLRNARSASGIRILTNQRFGPEGEIAAYVMSIVHPIKYHNRCNPKSLARSDEVKLRNPNEIEAVLHHAGASNILSWQTATSLNSTIFTDLPTVRNFYAHRNKDTWQKVRRKAQYRGMFVVHKAGDFIASPLAGRRVTQFEDWLDDAELFFDVCTA